MATEPPKVSGDFLQQKAGPLPIWAWAGLVLAAAYLYSKHKASAAAASTSSSTAGTSAAAGEPASSPPQWVIENNLPPSAPTPAPPASTGTGTTSSSPPTGTPTGTSPTPPVTLQGGNPPVGVGPLPVSSAPTSTAPTAGPKPPVAYTVVSGDTLSSIAARYGTSAAALFSYNTTPGVRPAATIATLKSRGPNLIFAGETILIPQS